MSTEPNTPTPYPTDDAHLEALHKIDPMDRQAGRLPCWDYAMDFRQIIGDPLPDVCNALMAYLDRTKPIREVPREYLITKQLFADNGCPMPDGMEDLPVIWACGIRRFVKEMLWVDRDQERLRRFFGWNLVMRQGPFLEILFKEPLASADWPERASLILELHRFLEPGGFTANARLQEFI